MPESSAQKLARLERELDEARRKANEERRRRQEAEGDNLMYGAFGFGLGGLLW